MRLLGLGLLWLSMPLGRVMRFLNDPSFFVDGWHA